MSEVFIIAETNLVHDGLDNFKDYLGIKDWKSDAYCDGEELIEIAGRLCYKSFNLELNKNLTRVREGNKDYIGNVLKQKHGSVFEHASVSIAMCNVSRILTHELVRHRAGVAYSQESQRFVRLDDFDVYIPELTPVFQELAKYAKSDGDNNFWALSAANKFLTAVNDVNSTVKASMAKLIQDYGLDNAEVPFHLKKQVTSALRRFVPGGVNTHIIVTANHRAWRHMIEMRTSQGAEQEIVEVFGKVAALMAAQYPAVYQDMHAEQVGNLTHYTFTNSKI